MTDLKMGEFFTLGGTEEEGEKAFDPSATENTSRPYKTGRPCHIQCTELTEDNSPTHPHKKAFPFLLGAEGPPSFHHIKERREKQGSLVTCMESKWIFILLSLLMCSETMNEPISLDL